MIRRVELLNFKAHQKASFKFGEGVNFIYGPNGAGKTSLMEAVAVALFGSQWVRRTGGRWADYVRRGASSGEVKLYLNHAGHEVVIVRKFAESGSSPSGTYLQYDGSIVARGDADVTAAVTTKLGLGVEEFRQLLYIRQGELRKILHEPEYIDRVLKLDEFDKLDEVLRDAYNELRAKRERVAGVLDALEKRAPLLRKQVEDLKTQLEETRRLVSRLEPQAAQYQEVERRYKSLLERRAAIQKEMESVEKRLGDLAEMDLELEREMEKAEAELGEIAKAREELANLPQVEDVEAQYFELKRAAQVLEKIPAEVRGYNPSALAEARRRLEDYTRRLAEMRSRLEFLRDVVKMAERAEGGRCPICGSPLGREQVERHVLEVRGLEKEVERLQKAVEELRGETRRLEELDKTYHSYREYLSLDPAAVKKKLAELERLYLLKKEVEKRRSYLQALISREEEVKRRISSLRERREDLARRVAEMDEKLKQLEREKAGLDEELAALEESYKALRSAYEQYLAARARLEEMEKMLRQSEAELARLQEEAAKAGREAERLDKALAEAKNIRAVLGELKPLARQIMIKAINDELNAVFLKLRHKESFKSVQLVESNGRYVVKINTPSGPIEHTLLSLGEQNLLALSLRVALARALLGHAPFIMLDEPTEHLDETHRRKIVELVRELTSVVPTVIVTSHLGEFEEAADVVIEL